MESKNVDLVTTLSNLMKRLLPYSLLFFISIIKAQDKAVTDWINSNAVVIEDANPDTKLVNFDKNVPDNFKNARVFGFGEATHHGKEFFDIKAKFFKYLVENQGITLFIMEESYQTERLVNQWLSGGEGGPDTILNSFMQNIWRTKETVALMQWMHDYNVGKPHEKQVRFYGIDNQMGYGLNVRLRNYAKKHQVAIDENLLVAADSASAGKLKLGGIKGWTDTYLPQLKSIEKILLSHKAELIEADEAGYNDMMRGFGYLKDYTIFIENPKSENRDRDMYKNVIAILEKEGINSKAFIWAHNEHVNKKDLYTSGDLSVGRRLKEHFKDAYYCVGFDFGKGTMKGYEIKKGKATKAVFNTLDEPYKNTYAKTLFEAQPDIYFIDMQKAEAAPSNFFGTKNQQIFLGGEGFNPDRRQAFLKRKYTETYDGIIFVKTISPVTY